MIKTIEQAHRFVKEVKICTIFSSDKTEHTSLWDHVDLPEKQPGESGWGEKMSAVWTWKTQLPSMIIFLKRIKISKLWIVWHSLFTVKLLLNPGIRLHFEKRQFKKLAALKVSLTQP